MGDRYRFVGHQPFIQRAFRFGLTDDEILSRLMVHRGLTVAQAADELEYAKQTRSVLMDPFYSQPGSELPGCAIALMFLMFVLLGILIAAVN